jgi:hypothetical protein
MRCAPLSTRNRTLAIHVDDPPDRARVTARLLGRRVDLLVTGPQLVTREHRERGQPTVSLATYEAQNPRLERPGPDPDRVPSLKNETRLVSASSVGISDHVSRKRRW